MADQVESALDLMRRMPPADIETNLGGLLDIVPDLTEDLLSAVDQPLKIASDPVTGKDYVLCDYNRDGDSYRSPWSNKYDPPLDDGALPSDRLRETEIQLNEVFDVYRDMYFEGGVSSVYAWDLDDDFAAVILIKKTGDVAGRVPVRGAWDSIHVVEVQSAGDKAVYKLTTTIMLWMNMGASDEDKKNLSGSLSRQTEQEMPVNDHDTHVVNIGRLIEDMEGKLRTTLELIYFGKTHDIIHGLRQFSGIAEANRQHDMASSVATGLKGQ